MCALAERVGGVELPRNAICLLSKYLTNCIYYMFDHIQATCCCNMPQLARAPLQVEESRTLCYVDA